MLFSTIPQNTASPIGRSPIPTDGVLGCAVLTALLRGVGAAAGVASSDTLAAAAMRAASSA